MDTKSFLDETKKEIEIIVKENGNIFQDEVEEILEDQYEYLYDFDTWGNMTFNDCYDLIKDDLNKYLNDNYKYDNKEKLYYI